MEKFKNTEESGNKFILPKYTGFIIAAFIVTIGILIMYGLFKSYTNLIIKNVFNKSRVILRKCDLNNKANIGCIAYIDNLRLKNKNFDYSKPLKELNGMSVKEFERKYVIVLSDPDTQKIYGTYKFYFSPEEPAVDIKIGKQNNKFVFLKRIKSSFVLPDKKADLFYFAIVQKKNKKGYLLNYYYSPKYWGIKEEYGIKLKNIKPFFYKGFQFIGDCKNFNKSLDGDVKCKKAKYILTLKKQTTKKDKKTFKN